MPSPGLFWAILMFFLLGLNQVCANEPIHDKLFLAADELVIEGKYKAALAGFEVAEQAFRETESWENVVYSLIRQAELLHSFQVNMGHMALPRAEQALVIMETKITPSRHLTLRLYNSLGYAYAKKLDYDNSKKYLDKALAINTAPFDSLAMLRTYEGLGKLEMLSGNDEGAINNLKKGASLYPKSGNVNHVNSSGLLNDYATVLCTMGDYDQSLDYLQRRLNLVTKMTDNDHPEVLNTLYYIGNVYYYAEDYANALTFYNTVKPEWEKQLDSTHAYLASLYSAMADMYWGTEDYKSAMEHYDLAATLEMAYLGEEKATIDDLMTDSASVFTEIGDYDNAMKYYNKALEYRKAKYGHRSELVGGCNNYIANAFRQKKEYRKSLEIYQESIRILVVDFEEEDVYVNPSLDLPCTSDKYLLDALHAKADLFFKIYENESQDIKDLEAAFQTYLHAAELIDKIRLSPKSSGSKLFWSQKALPIYEGGINIAYTLHQSTNDKNYIEEAFRLAEKSKSFQLLANLQENEAMEFSGIPDSIREEERAIKEQIAETERKIFFEKKKSEPNKGKIKLWDDRLLALKLEYDKFIIQLEKKFPDYYNLKFNIGAVDLKVVRRILFKSDKDFLIEIFEGENYVFIFSISKKKFDVKRLENNFELTASINQLRQSISDIRFVRAEPVASFNQMTRHGRSLFNLLLSDIIDVDGVVDNLIVIPDGKFSNIPFEILLTEDVANKERQYAKLPYLIRQTTISYGNSATLLVGTNNLIRGKRKEQFIGFAPEYQFSSEEIAGYDLVSRDSLGGLADLKFNIEETQKAASLFRGRVFDGKDATESNFKKEALSSRIIHLAMHALVDNEAPSYSKLLFYPENESGEDGMLNTYELYNMQLGADLVVLSACNTGRGKLVKSEGVQSLARGFLYSGCPSIVNTQWTVDDESTSLLMQHFYKNLAQGKPKDLALKEAKITLLKESDPAIAHPYYWAGFVLNGNTSPIGSNSGPWLFYVLLGIAIGILLLLWIKSKF
ncbi:MAG: CHAT domain-containing protein [Bacteroidota bacterium]